MDVEVIALLLVAAFAAGWVDAVVGGGGLIQLPALMLALPGQPVAALATNKLGSIAGTSTAAVTYLRRAQPDLRTAVPAGVLAVGFAAVGALCAAAMSTAVLRPVIIVVLVGVAVVVVLRPDLGKEPVPVERTRARTVAAIAVPGVLIAFYDGLVGPGTGTFLVLAFTSLLGSDFVNASANAKIINTGTNFGALVVFGLQGHILWTLGAAMAVGNIAGARLGAGMAISRGTGFVRAVLLVVVTGMVLRLGLEQFG